MKSVIFGAALGILVGSGAAAAQGLPEGARFAYIDIARVASESTEGQASTAKVQELSQQKLAELEAANTEAQGRVNGLNQQLVAAQQKLQQGANVISVEAAASLQREINRLQVDLQRQSQDSQAELERLTQDADAAVQELQQQLQVQFEQKLIPAIDQLAAEQGLSFIFNAAQGLIWADPSLDVTQEIIDTLNRQVTTP